MAYTLLNAVNATLKRVKIITGVNGALTSLTDSPRQTFIDQTVQIINESIHELYSESELPQPNQSASSTITLASGQREYDLPVDLEQIRYPLIDQTHGKYIFEYPGGFEKMRVDQLIPGNFKGIPIYACINPTNDMLRLNTIPQATDAGLVYDLLYDARHSLSLAGDTFPFSDTVVDSLVPAWAERWKREQRNAFDKEAHDEAFGRAMRYLNQTPLRRKW